MPIKRRRLHDDQTIDMDSIPKLFSKHCKEIGLDVPNNFLKLSASAMINLRENNRENTVYNLVLGIGTMREDGSDSCFPVKRMPMGLVEYAASFFSVKDHNKVIMKNVYTDIIICMYSYIIV